MKIITHSSGYDIREAEDLHHLSVEASRSTSIAAALGELGRVEDNYAWLSIATLGVVGAGQVPAPQRSNWTGQFDSMVAYARAKGWVSADGGDLRAHIEWTD